MIVYLFISSSAFAVINTVQKPFDRQQLIQILNTRANITELDQVPQYLPGDFLINFTLKHGYKRIGERGHLIETKVSQSSDPNLPRAIVWDERSGFTISYNGGGPGQTAGQRLDLLTFDNTKKTFSLEQIDFPQTTRPVKVTTSDCNTCHGPWGRPIFSMYPDWPSFYGSDNDELTDGTKNIQNLELKDFRNFTATTAFQHPRYRALYNVAHIQKYLGIPIYETFPYRQNISTEVEAVSRSFTFRPSLRLGILYNRLNAQHLIQRIKAQPEYLKWMPLVAFNIMQCEWPAKYDVSRKIWLARAQTKLKKSVQVISGGRLDYLDAWALLGLRINDVDIRYSYNHEGYKNTDATNRIMEVGYIKENGVSSYYNSYFDGASTIDELMAVQMLKELSIKWPHILMGLNFRGLTTKYSHLVERYKFDKEFFNEMDRKGMWMPLPFPKMITDLHHREPFKDQFKMQQKAACEQIVETFLK